MVAAAAVSVMAGKHAMYRCRAAKHAETHRRHHHLDPYCVAVGDAEVLGSEGEGRVRDGAIRVIEV